MSLWSNITSASLHCSIFGSIHSLTSCFKNRFFSVLPLPQLYISVLLYTNMQQQEERAVKSFSKTGLPITVLGLHQDTISYLIFVIFSPQRQFVAQFFSTQKCVNCDKTDFATRVRKSQQNQFYNKTA